jgi:hypothetical protein
MRNLSIGGAAKTLVFGAVLLINVLTSESTKAAGVTIITHGFDGDVMGWITAMAEEIPAYYHYRYPELSTNFTVYTLVLTYTNGLYYYATTKNTTNSPSSTDTGEIIVKLDWSQMAGTITGFVDPFNDDPSTYNVGWAVSYVLRQTNTIQDLDGHALAELPMHLIGHSRGGSLMNELSRQLGTNGIWVDHLTTLDPHPFNNDGNTDLFYQVDASASNTWENVLFRDNYWQDLGVLTDPDGEPASGAYNRELYDLSEGYNLTDSDSPYHSNVHLWYHGTLDLNVPTSYDDDGETVTIDADMRTNWWVADEDEGVIGGFYYSLTGGGNRMSVQQPLGPGFPAIVDGYNQWWDLGAGNSSNRTVLPVNSGTWPNLIKFDVVGTNIVTAGQGIATKFYYQYGGPSNSVTAQFYFDSDFNPYNTNSTSITEISLPNTGTNSVNYDNVTLTTANVSPGIYFIYAKISDGLHTRYLYTPELVQIVTVAGSLQVTIAPPSAVSAGAQWEVDGGAWQNSGVTVTNLSVGDHTVSFNTISGWTTPANQTVSISANSTATTGGTYVVITQTGSLQVTISAASAVTAGAQWQVDNGAWQNSGATVSGLSVGNHTVSFNTISGWTTPASQTVSVAANSTARASGTYVQQFGSLKVTISPALAISAGAKWQVDGGTWRNSGATVANLPVGNHTVSFTTISGWTTPTNQTVSVRFNSTATASGTYVRQTGSLTVTISPEAAISAGAKWRVDEGTLQTSGATVTNLWVENHTVSFNTISGWVTPSNQTISVNANSTAAASGTYVPQTGSLKVIISPAGAITSGAQWQVDGGTLQSSGATVSNLSLGAHAVSFNTVSGWTAPSNQAVSIKAKSVAKAEGTYVFSAHGIYNGLFMQADATEETAGMLSGLDVTASGTYSGQLWIGGGPHYLSGGFNVSGQASNYVQRTARLGGPLTVEMTLNWNDSPPNITGTVSGTNGGPWVANLTNELAAKESSSAEYTALVLPAGTPPGYGYILITNHAGAVILSGALADGTLFSQSVPLSGAGDLPVYGNLYGGTGLLLGWIGLESGSPTGTLTWIKPASRSTALYTNGFTNLAVVQGSPWTNPLPHTAAIDLPSGQLDIAGGALLSNLNFNVAVSNNNALVKLAGSPTNSLSGSINPKTGLLTITFGNGAGRATTAGKGAVLQNATNAGGFFLGKTNAGSIFLQP